MGDLTQEKISEFLSYDIFTGIFTWKHRDRENFDSSAHFRSWNTRRAGQKAGKYDGNGYLLINLFRQKFLAHRLAWFYVHNAWPVEIDHINHVRDDNRLQNLRSVDHSTNGKNLSKNKKNTSGYTGVYWDKSINRWCANIVVDGEKISLGTFIDKDEALITRRLAEKDHGFHSNHGRSIKAINKTKPALRKRPKHYSN